MSSTTSAQDPIVARGTVLHADSTSIVRIVSLHDVDRDITIPPSTYLRWAMEARWQSFEQWEALRKLRSTPGARMMVKAQCVRQTDAMMAANRAVPGGPGAHRILPKSFAPGTKVEIRQTPYSVSSQSFTLAYEIRDAERPSIVAANVFVVMVCTFVDPDTGVAKASKLPEFVSQGLPWLHRNASMTGVPSPATWTMPGTSNGSSNGSTPTSLTTSVRAAAPRREEAAVAASSPVPTALTLGYRALQQYVANEMSGHLSREGAFSHELLVRSSDEDVNHHVTHSRFAEFFQDALASALPRGVAPIHAEGHPSLFYVEYMRELKAGARCDVVVVPHDTTSVVLFILEREASGRHGAPVCRALATWDLGSADAPETSLAIIE